MHFEQILLLWFVWERRALNIRALCKKFFFANLWIPSLFQWTFPNELSWGEIVWMPLVAPDGSVHFCNSHSDPTQCRRSVFLAEPSTALVCTEHKLFVRCVSHRGRGSCPCDTHVAQIVVLTQVVHVTSVL